MSHIDLFINTQVYYICLKFKSKIFADERDKRKFLDFVLQRQNSEKVRVFAFAVLDDEIHLLIGIPGEKQKAADESDGILKNAETFVGICAGERAAERMSGQKVSELRIWKKQ